MNYSYVMGVNNIDALKQDNFKIKSFGNKYGVIFDDNKIELFEKIYKENNLIYELHCSGGVIN